MALVSMRQLLDHAAEHGAPYPFCVVERHLQADAAAHRVTEQVRVGHAQVVEQACHVGGHQRAVIGLGVVRLVAVSVPAAVESDHAPPGGGQRLLPARAHPIESVVTAVAVHEYDWRPVLGSVQLVVQSRTGGVEIGHFRVRYGISWASRVRD